jgi:hypothetical protein
MRDETQCWEILLARLFVDGELRARFKRDPRLVGKEFGLDENSPAFTDIDWVGLDLAAQSYAHKASEGRQRRK